MNEYQKMLHEIEDKKQDLEQQIAAAVQEKVSKWQADNQLPVQSIYIDLTDVSSLGEPKRYEVSKALVDLDYKP